MSMNTTKSSTGEVGGACTLVEDRLGGTLLYLACHHQVRKLIIGNKVEVIIPEVSCGQNIKLFQRLSQQ